MNFPHLETSPTLKHPSETLSVGVVFSGGQAAGGHDVVAGLFDSLKKLNPQNRLFGFRGGPKGILTGSSLEITADVIEPYRSQGGFDLLGSGRDKIEKPEQFKQAIETARRMKLDGLVIIGGDDSNTNAAFLAEAFLEAGLSCSVIGVPKTIDGDLQNAQVAISFGFDTASKTYAATIGSLARDALSAGKYTFFVRLMGRSASHITLECALRTHPNFAFISEEIALMGYSLQELVGQLADMVEMRAKAGKTYGVVLIPEGIVEFIPEVKQLIGELNKILAEGEFDPSKLSPESARAFKTFPESIRAQLLRERDPHGNVQVSKIESERLFIELVEEELKRRGFSGSFSAQPIFLGYEGRSCHPSLFDSTYSYALGETAAKLIHQGATGMMAAVTNLTEPSGAWRSEGVPLISLIHMEMRKGKSKAVIAKALVDLEGTPFRDFAAHRNEWMKEDRYLYPLPIQADDASFPLILRVARDAMA